MALYPLLRPIAFAVEAERAHAATLRLLRLLPPGPPPPPDPKLSTTVAGIAFPNPVGLAAGFDKNGCVFRQMLGFGFGFVEIGTVTPRPQAGNPRPRLFRLREDRAVVNRLGFNNAGQAAAAARLAKRKRGTAGSPGAGVVGANIGANKENAAGAAAIADYETGARTMSAHADYLTVNVSSPNTPGLRALQDAGMLRELLAATLAARTAPVPVFLKVAPDLDRGEIEAVSAAAIEAGAAAIVIGNTSLSRPDLVSPFGRETGGLSGAPIKNLALQRLRDFRSASGGEIPLIAVGGIENGVDAFDRILAGASLVQLYTALVYEGPGLARRINGELKRLLAIKGYGRLSDAIGAASR
jgi:dihydroorotate dehydrogenase